jgi:hypothetical protein
MNGEIDYDDIAYDRNKKKKMRAIGKYGVQIPKDMITGIQPAWVLKLLAKCIQTNRPIIPLTKCRVVTTDGPLKLNYPKGEAGIRRLIESCKNVIQGSSTKGFQSAIAPAVPALTNIDLLTNQCFGYIIRISDSDLAARHGGLDFSLTFDQGGAVARTFLMSVMGTDPVYEFFTLAFTSNGGNAEVGRSDGLRLTINTVGQPVNDGVTALRLETVNGYDFNAQ